MFIDQSKCVVCKRCIPYCPREAIKEVDGKMIINLELCVECGVCLRTAKCPKDAIYNECLAIPRAYRKAFSDPFGKHENTELKHSGRGTEEGKTNDVTGMVHTVDVIQVAIELGRPGVGASFIDVEKVTKAIVPYVIKFEKNNPVMPLIADVKTGKLIPEILEESIMSCIIEFSCQADNLGYLLENLKQVANEIDTVFSLGLVCKVDEMTDTIPVQAVLETLNLDLTKASAKTNMGLGRPRYDDCIKEA